MQRIIGYLRADATRQSEQTQLNQLLAAGATKVYREPSVDARRDRPQLDKLLADIREGDTVLVTSLDRIARNTRHLLEIVASFDAAGVTFKVLDNGIDTSTSQGPVLKSLLCSISDFERQVVRERQAEGIERAKREGRYKGRKPLAMARTDEVLALNAQGATRQKIADQLGIGVASVYRILKNHAMTTPKQKVTPPKPVVTPKPAERKPSRKPETAQMSLF